MKNLSKILSLIYLLFLMGSSTLSAQEKLLGRFTVEAGDHTRINTPVSVPLDGIKYKSSTGLKLLEIKGSKRLDVPVQIEKGYSYRLWWILAGTTKQGDQRIYELIQQEELKKGPEVQAIKNDTSLVVYLKDKKILQYNHAIMPPPDNTNKLYSRSGFIHPLWSSSGAELTRIHAPDHIHHMGIWSSWTKTKFEGREIDFWNLNKGEGTVRFANYTAIVSGNVYGGFRAIQKHVDLKAPGGEKLALTEEWDVRIWNGDEIQKQEAYLWDFTSTLNPATASSIILKKYRYAGFGFRATWQWNKDNSSIQTSEGKTRINADATNARWCNIYGETEKGKAGILFMSHPKNYNHPEPMRIWPLNSNNGKGDVFFQFSPTKEKDWILEAGNNYVLKYRMYVYDGTITTDEAERIWQDFGNPPKVRIEDVY